MKKKQWKTSDRIVLDESGKTIAVVMDDISRDDAAIIENAPEAFSSIREFVDGVNSGSLKPRAAVKRFEKILEKTNQ